MRGEKGEDGVAKEKRSSAAETAAIAVWGALLWLGSLVVEYTIRGWMGLPAGTVEAALGAGFVLFCALFAIHFWKWLAVRVRKEGALSLWQRCLLFFKWLVQYPLVSFGVFALAGAAFLLWLYATPDSHFPEKVYAYFAHALGDFHPLMVGAVAAALFLGLGRAGGPSAGWLSAVGLALAACLLTGKGSFGAVGVLAVGWACAAVYANVRALWRLEAAGDGGGGGGGGKAAGDGEEGEKAESGKADEAGAEEGSEGEEEHKDEMDGAEDEKEKRFFEWLKGDKAVRRPEQDRFRVHSETARRIARRLRGEEEFASVVLYGPYGSGKTTVGHLVRYYLRGDRLGELKRGVAEGVEFYGGPVELVMVSAWAYEDARALMGGILDALTDALAPYRDVFPLKAVRRDYLRAVTGAGGALGAAAGWLSGFCGPRAVLERLDRACERAGVRLVLWLDDLDRFGSAAEKGEARKAQSLLDLLANREYVSFVLTGTSVEEMGGKAYTDRLGLYIEKMPEIEADLVGKLLRIFRDRIKRTTDERTKGENIPVDLRGLDGDGNFLPLLGYPRRLKNALRRTWRAWGALMGEIEFCSLLAFNALREVKVKVKKENGDIEETGFGDLLREEYDSLLRKMPGWHDYEASKDIVDKFELLRLRKYETFGEPKPILSKMEELMERDVKPTKDNSAEETVETLKENIKVMPVETRASFFSLSQYSGLRVPGSQGILDVYSETTSYLHRALREELTENEPRDREVIATIKEFARFLREKKPDTRKEAKEPSEASAKMVELFEKHPDKVAQFADRTGEKLLDMVLFLYTHLLKTKEGYDRLFGFLVTMLKFHLKDLKNERGEKKEPSTEEGEEWLRKMFDVSLGKPEDDDQKLRAFFFVQKYIAPMFAPSGFFQAGKDGEKERASRLYEIQVKSILEHHKILGRILREKKITPERIGLNIGSMLLPRYGGPMTHFRLSKETAEKLADWIASTMEKDIEGADSPLFFTLSFCGLVMHNNRKVSKNLSLLIDGDKTFCNPINFEGLKEAATHTIYPTLSKVPDGISLRDVAREYWDEQLETRTVPAFDSNNTCALFDVWNAQLGYSFFGHIYSILKDHCAEIINGAKEIAKEALTEMERRTKEIETPKAPEASEGKEEKGEEGREAGASEESKGPETPKGPDGPGSGKPGGADGEE